MVLTQLTFESERIALLIHILCELRTSHGITAQKLKEAGQPIQQHISPIERLKLLDELYYVREKEENFLDAVTGRFFAVICKVWANEAQMGMKEF